MKENLILFFSFETELYDTNDKRHSSHIHITSRQVSQSPFEHTLIELKIAKLKGIRNERTKFNLIKQKLVWLMQCNKWNKTRGKTFNLFKRLLESLSVYTLLCPFSSVSSIFGYVFIVDTFDAVLITLLKGNRVVPVPGTLSIVVYFEERE